MLVRDGWMRAVAFLMAVAALGVGQERQPSEELPRQVLAELRAADDARARLLAEEQDWRMERQRLELLRDTIRRRADQLDEDAAEAQDELEALQQEVKARDDAADDVQAVRDMLDRLAAEANDRLQELSNRTPPGFVPRRATDDGGGDGPLLAVVQRMQGAMRRAESSGVELVNVSVDGEQTAVKLLRIGGVGAWWMSLSGDRGGTATVEGGRLRLHPAALPASFDAIARAFDIAEGRAAPEWVSLPVEHLEAR